MRIRLAYKDLMVSFWGYAFALTLVLQCRSMWMSSSHSNLLSYLLLFSLFISSIAYTLHFKLSKVTISNIVIISCIFLLYSILFLLINSLNATSYIRFAVAELIIFFLVEITEYKNILKLLIYYENVVYIICLISLVFWLFGSCLGVLHPNGSILTNWTGKANVTKYVNSYYGIYFEPQSINFLHIIRVTRNCAIFTEAPMCNLHFCLALLIQLFLNQKKNVKKIIFFIIGILSTFSSTGYICVIIVLTAKYVISRPKISLLRILKIIVFPLLFAIVIYATWYFLMNKLSLGTSGSTRLDDFRAGFLAWSTHPIFGNGFGNSDSYIQYMSTEVRATNNFGFSNSPMQILSYGGLYLACPYIFCIGRSIINLINKKMVKEFIFFVSFCYLFTITLISFQYLTIFLMMLFTKKHLSNSF